MDGELPGVALGKSMPCGGWNCTLDGTEQVSEQEVNSPSSRTGKRNGFITTAAHSGWSRSAAGSFFRQPHPKLQGSHHTQQG